MSAVVIAMVTMTSLSMVWGAPSQGSSIELLMPQVQPKQVDTYLCVATKIEDARRYITGYVPKADSHTAHHILLYGCDQPGNVPNKPWNCGEMASHNSDFDQGSVCQSGESILYAWAMDAPKLELPEGVGFEVGQDTPIKYLVVQVHYKNVSSFVPPENGHDSSGLVLETTTKQTPKLAGIYLLLTGGSIPSHSIEYFDSACEYNEERKVIPFAYRTHAHSLGRVISGYRVRNGEWKEIGRKDPRLPEMFYNVTNPGMDIKKGDILAARCTMENTKDHVVEIGATQQDEMCNFYIMYYVERPATAITPHCITPGPPFWYWSDYADAAKLNVNAAPATASLVPGTATALRRNATQASTGPDVLSVPGFEETVDSDVNPDGNGIVANLPGGFQDQSVADNLDEAIREMSPDELLFLIQQLAREEEEANVRDKMWRERQMIRERQLFPY